VTLSEGFEQGQLRGGQGFLCDYDFVEGGARHDRFQIGERAQHRVAMEQLAVLETAVVQQSQQFGVRANRRVQMLNGRRAASIGADNQKAPCGMRQEAADALEQVERPARTDQEIEQQQDEHHCRRA